MDSQTAAGIINELRTANGPWKDKKHIATDCFRDGVIAQLSRDPLLSEDISCSLAEIYLTEELPDIDAFCGIFAVDEIGIWYYDGDGGIQEHVWRQRVIPWRYVKGVVLHQNS